MSVVFVDPFVSVLKHVEQAVDRNPKLRAQTQQLIGHFFVQIAISALSEFPFPLRKRLSPTWDRLKKKEALNTQSFGSPMHQATVLFILPQRPYFAFFWRHFIVQGEHLCIRGLDPIVFSRDRELWCVRGVVA